MRQLLFGAAGVALVSVTAPAAAAPVLWSGNGHYYEFVAGGFTFDQALAAASASSFNGMQGYLATITSSAENQFVAALSSAGGWAGGSDRETEGVWKWVSGPEAGTLLSFTAWNAGEPNNFGNEDGLLILSGGWNDLNTGASFGYFIEYGGLGSPVPEPATWAMMIAGFGLAGGAMRSTARRRTLTAA